MINSTQASALIDFDFSGSPPPPSLSPSTVLDDIITQLSSSASPSLSSHAPGTLAFALLYIINNLSEAVLPKSLEVSAHLVYSFIHPFPRKDYM
jgi:hypothetical protein